MNNCIKEYQNNDCYQQEIKYEKSKLHTRYLFGIAGILIVLSIAIKLGNNDGFAAQISMASTISSIILSAIAIFMSISSENKNSYIQNQMVETSAKLTKVCNKIENISEGFDGKVELIETILRNVKEDTQDVKNKLETKFNYEANTITRNLDEKLSNNEIVKIYQNLKKVTEINEILEYILVVISHRDEIEGVSSKETKDYMNDVKGYDIKDSRFHFYWGTIIIFSILGITCSNHEGVSLLLNEVKKNIDVTDESVILTFHDMYNKNRTISE